MHVYACTCMYVYAVLVCVNTHMLQCAYGSQRKPLVVGTCVPSSLRQGLLVACCYASYARLDGTGASGILQIYFLSHFSITGITDMCHYSSLHKCSWFWTQSLRLWWQAPYLLIHLPSSLYNTFELINEEKIKKYRSQFCTS